MKNDAEDNYGDHGNCEPSADCPSVALVEANEPGVRLGPQNARPPERTRFVPSVGKRDASARGLLLVVDDVEVVERCRAVGEAHQFIR